jgi:hypothetical protein
VRQKEAIIWHRKFFEFLLESSKEKLACTPWKIFKEHCFNMFVIQYDMKATVRQLDSYCF